MCGIVGIVNLDNKNVDTDLLYKMTSILQHRGPDDEGHILLNSRELSILHLNFKNIDDRIEKRNQYDMVLGHRRLSIIDLSEAGHQPMGSQDGNLWIVHNGEVYNYVDIRDQLQRKGYRFR